MTRRKRERRRASARRRVETHEVGGGSNYLKMPEGMGFFQAKPGRYRLDFLCYEVTKGKGEDGGNPFFEKGELAFERTFWVHRGIGPNEDWHLCAAKTKNEPCPVCEYRAKLARDPDTDEETLKSLAPKERQLWLVKDLAEPDDVKLFEMSYHLFGRKLDDKIRSGDEEDGYDYFADPSEGLTVKVVFEQSDRGKWVEAVDIEFRPRKEDYEDEVSEMPDLDEMLVATPYDKLKKALLQTDDEDGEDDETEPEEKPKRVRKTKAKKEPEPEEEEDEDWPTTAEDAGLEEGMVVVHDGAECEIVRISKDGTSLTLEDEDGETIKGVGCDDVEKAEKKKPAKRKPAKKSPPKRGGKARAKKEPEPEPEEEGEEDEDDEWDDWDD